MRKKLFSLILALLLLFSLSAAAFAGAETAVLSSQNLSVNGEDWSEVEKYNIDGKNYFKLRDLAALLGGTEARFAVGYDAASNTVSITRGGEYEYIGTELVFVKDNSKTAVTSAQTITVDGKTISGLTVYNIGGSNFFQLRELGDLLGFAVDYDDATRTMLVESPYLPFEIYVIAKETYSRNGTNGTTAYEYDSHGRQTRTITTEGGSVYVDETAYNADGLVISEKSYINGSLSEATTYEYDSCGNLTRNDYKHLSSGYSTHYSAAYWADGKLNWTEYSDSDGFWIREEYTYDAKGDLVKQFSDFGESNATTTYTLDSESRVLNAKTVFSDGFWSNYSYTYSGDMVTREVLTTSTGYGSTVDSRYDAYGNKTYQKYSDTDGYEQIDTYDYTAEGWLKKCVIKYGGIVETTEYTYNEIGQTLTTKIYDTAGNSSQTTCKYDGYYNIIEENYVNSDGNSYTSTYTYDANGNMTSSVVTGSDGSVERYTYEWTLFTINP